MKILGEEISPLTLVAALVILAFLGVGLILAVQPFRTAVKLLLQNAWALIPVAAIAGILIFFMTRKTEEIWVEWEVAGERAYSFGRGCHHLGMEWREVLGWGVYFQKMPNHKAYALVGKMGTTPPTGAVIVYGLKVEGKNSPPLAISSTKYHLTPKEISKLDEIEMPIEQAVRELERVRQASDAAKEAVEQGG